MQKLFVVVICMCGFFTMSWSQVYVNNVDINAMEDLEYIEILGVNVAFFGKNLRILVDYGQNIEAGTDTRVMDLNKKPKKFESMIGALNFFSQNGWEYVDAYAVSQGNSSVYHYLLKRRR